MEYRELENAREDMIPEIVNAKGPRYIKFQVLWLQITIVNHANFVGHR